MTDQTNPIVPPTDGGLADNAVPATPLKRVFKIGTNRVTEDSATAKLSTDQIKKLLQAQYPEIANATVRETISGDTRTIEFLPIAGRKG
ncbi:MAG: PRTRC system protein C [Aggregatilineales bacterium]